MKEPNYAPLYASLYPDLARIARRHGYALAIHGTLARDFDVIAIPWAAEVDHPESVVEEITRTYDIRVIGDATIREHGRIVYTISISGGAFLDFSFTPVPAPARPD